MRTASLRPLLLAAGLLALGGSLFAQAPGPGCGRGFGPGPGPAGEGRMLRRLNLTDAQKAQVKAIHQAHQSAFQAKGDAAKAARQAMHDAMVNSATDSKTLQALHEKVSAAQFDLMLEHRAVRQEILPLLTPDQKTQFEQGPMGKGQGRGQGQGRRPGGRGRSAGAPAGQAS